MFLHCWLIYNKAATGSKRTSSFQKQEHPVNLELNVYVLSSLELSYYAPHWLVPESCWDTGSTSSSFETIRLSNVHPTCTTRTKKKLQAEYNSLFTDPYWETHIQALQSTASRWHLTGHQHHYLQHSIQIVFELAIWEPGYAQVFAYAEIATAAAFASRVVNHGQVRDNQLSRLLRGRCDCCYYSLLSPTGTSPALSRMIQAKQDYLSALISQPELLSMQILVLLDLLTQ